MIPALQVRPIETCFYPKNMPFRVALQMRMLPDGVCRFLGNQQLLTDYRVERCELFFSVDLEAGQG